MMRKRRLLLAAGGTAALGACSFSLEHGLFNPCRARLPRELASDKRFPRHVFETRRFFDAQESAASAHLPRAG